MTPEAEKISHSTIMSYMNTPFMERFGRTKEIAVKFIISRYHNGKFYFDRPVEISGEVNTNLLVSQIRVTLSLLV